MHATTLRSAPGYDISLESVATFTSEDILDPTWKPRKRWGGKVLPGEESGTIVSAPSTTPGVSGMTAEQASTFIKLQEQTLIMLKTIHERQSSGNVNIQTVTTSTSTSGSTSVTSTTTEKSQHNINVDGVKCLTCGKEFSTHSRAMSHYKLKHLGLSTHQCDICKKFLGSPANLASHKATQHGGRSYRCKVCQTVFKSTFKKMEKHMKKHGGWVRSRDKGLVCPFCLQVYSDASNHKNQCKHNPKAPRPSHMCRHPGCGALYSQIKYRNYHEAHKCPYRPKK